MITRTTLSPGITVLTLENASATAKVSLYGGHVLSYVPKGQKDVLFVSEKSLFEPGKPIRGGIPVCWPWFGPSADKTLPIHGFARLAQWNLVSSEEKEDRTTIVLECLPTDATRVLWPHDFRLLLSVTAGKSLELALTTENAGKETIRVSDALHTYFSIADARKVSVAGFDGARYIDRVGERTERDQAGEVTIVAETDRVYLGGKDCSVIDAVTGRSVAVRKDGFTDTVIWNPWIEKAKAMPDFADDEYLRMICAEAGSVLGNAFDVAPGASVTQRMTLVPGAR